MGMRYRKSLKFGPLRVNLSKSGVGYSVGNKFYRVTKKADGGMRTTATLPGTGISNVKDYSKDQVEEAVQMPRTGKKKVPAIVGGAVALLVLIGVVTGGGDDSSKDKDSTPSTRQEQTVKPSTSTKTTTTTKTDTTTPSTQAETKAETSTPSTPTETKTETPALAPQPSTKTDTTAQASQPATQNERKVYRTKTGKRYHYDSHCNGGDYYEVTLSDAQNAGLTPCQKCAGG